MRTDLKKTQWCPWCGDFFILVALNKALKELEIPREHIVIVSGVGCSGKFSQYVDGYAAETLHGRTIPFATGVKLANPDLTVIAIGGDGDGYGIGLSHFLNGARRDANILYIVCNNENYALTTGQASPTTPCGVKTSSTPEGNTMHPLQPLQLAQAAGARFTKQTSSDKMNEMKDIIKEGINFKGFAHIDIQQVCPSWKKR